MAEAGAPFTAINHHDRIWLALVLYSRYSANWTEAAEKIAAYVPESEAVSARALGLALRLGHTISGGLMANLEGVSLTAEGGGLKLRATSPTARDLIGLVVEKRLQALAGALSLRAEID